MNVYYQKFLKYKLEYKNDLSYDIHHLHQHLEIIHMVHGSATVFVDNTEYEISENKAIIIEPYKIHHSKSDWQNRVYVSYISPSLIPSFSEIMRDNTLDNPVIALDNQKNKVCIEMLGYIMERFRIYPKHRPDYFHTTDDITSANTRFVKHFCESYMSLLLENAAWQKKTPSIMDNAKRILEYCLANYNKDISLSKIAEEMGITEATVTRVFTNTVKCPFRTYINNLRLAEVADRLSSTNMPIGEIADKCGFETLRTFNRVFISSYGMTPSEYRRKHAEKTNDT